MILSKLLIPCILILRSCYSAQSSETRTMIISKNILAELNNSKSKLYRTKCAICTKQLITNSTGDKKVGATNNFGIVVCPPSSNKHYFHTDCLFENSIENIKLPNLNCPSCKADIKNSFHNTVIYLLQNEKNTKSTLLRYLSKVPEIECKNIFSEAKLENASLLALLCDSLSGNANDLLQEIIIANLQIIETSSGLASLKYTKALKNPKEICTKFPLKVLKTLTEESITCIFITILFDKDEKKKDNFDNMYKVVCDMESFEFSDLNARLIILSILKFNLFEIFDILNFKGGSLKSSILTLEDFINAIKQHIETKGSKSKNLGMFISWFTRDKTFSIDDILKIIESFKKEIQPALHGDNMKYYLDDHLNTFFRCIRYIPVKEDIEKIIKVYSQYSSSDIYGFLRFLNEYLEGGRDNDINLIVPLYINCNNLPRINIKPCLFSWSSITSIVEDIIKDASDKYEIHDYLISNLLCFYIEDSRLDSDSLIKMLNLALSHKKNYVINYLLYKATTTLFKRLQNDNKIKDLIKICNESNQKYIRYFLNHIEDTQDIEKYTNSIDINENLDNISNRNPFIHNLTEPYINWYTRYDIRLPFFYINFSFILSNILNKFSKYKFDESRTFFNFMSDMLNSTLTNNYIKESDIQNILNKISTLKSAYYLHKSIIIILKSKLSQAIKNVIIKEIFTTYKNSTEYNFKPNQWESGITYANTVLANDRPYPYLLGFEENKLRTIFDLNSPVLSKLYANLNIQIMILWLEVKY